MADVRVLGVQLTRGCATPRQLIVAAPIGEAIVLYVARGGIQSVACVHGGVQRIKGMYPNANNLLLFAHNAVNERSSKCQRGMKDVTTWEAV